MTIALTILAVFALAIVAAWAVFRNHGPHCPCDACMTVFFRGARFHDR